MKYLASAYRRAERSHFGTTTLRRAFRTLLILCIMLSIDLPARAQAEITLITIYGKACQNCYDGVTINREGTLSLIGLNLFQAKDPDQVVGSIIATFPRSEFETARGANVTAIGAIGVGLKIHYSDGTEESAIVPVGGPTAIQSIAKLQLWVQNAAFLATEANLSQRWRGLKKDILNRQLQIVSLEMLGCYGRCAKYSVRFSAAGTADLREQGPNCWSRAHAKLPFDLIADVAKYSSAERMLPAYPSKFTDQPMARITIVSASGTYVSNGPDETTWGSAFAAMQGRLDQIVRMVKWTPSLQHKLCA